jgi:DnaJ-class molecular chaperone
MEKKAKFVKWFPQDICVTCNGEGKVKSEWISGGFFGGGHYEYKKCFNCGGDGKNNFTCLTCKEKLYHNIDMACVNQNCKMYNIMVLLANDHKE